MKTFRSSDNGTPRNQRHTLLIAAIVVIVSMIIGAWTMAALAISTYTSPYMESLCRHAGYDDITEARKEAQRQAKEERKKAIKKAKAEREEALKQAKIEREIAAKERKLALKQAKIEREIALKQAKIEREIAAKERKHALKQAKAEREIALKQAKIERELAAKEREHALKEARMEREMAIKQANIERKRIATERKHAKNREKSSHKKSRDSIYKLVKQQFKGLSIGNNIMVVFTQGSASKLAEMTGDAAELGQIEFSYDNGTLHIGYRKNHDDFQSRTVIYLTNPDLYNVSLDDAAALTVQGNLNISDLKISAKGAASVNIPSLSGSNLNVITKDASQVTILSTEANTIEIKSTGASKARLKGICCRSITSRANDAAEITITGRCNKNNANFSDLGKVHDSGLIIESQKVECNPSPSKRKMPRKP